MPHSPDDSRKSGRAWLLLGSGCLLFLALFWSVDSTVIFVSLGGAVFCFFQYVRIEYKSARKTEPRREYREQASPSSRSVDDLLQEIQRNFKSKGSGKLGRGVIRAVIGIMAIIFTLTFLINIFSGDVLDDTAAYWRAAEFYDQGEYDSAAFYYRRAVVEEPDNADLYYYWGNSLLNLNKHDSALLVYDLALSLNPEYRDAQYGKGYVFFQQKKYREAIRETSRITKYQPDDLNAMLLIGDCYYSTDLMDSALVWYNGAYSTGYRSPSLSYVMAYIYDTQGQTPTAIKFYKEVLSLDSSYTDIYTRLGEIVPGEEGNMYRTRAAQLQSN